MSDSDSWVGMSNLGVAVLSALGTAIVGAIGLVTHRSAVAVKEGETDGVLQEWRRGIETRMQENTSSIRDVEARVNVRIDAAATQSIAAAREAESRLNARMDSADIRQLRAEERSEQFALRSDVTAGFDRIELQLRGISEWIHTKPRQ